MSESSESIISKLAEAGVQAVECPACGRVREMQENRIVAHGVPVCPGSGHFVASPLDQAFNEIVAPVAEEIEHNSLGHAPDCDGDCEADWMDQAMEAVHDHLVACFQHIDCSNDQCDHDKGDCPPDPAHAPFDGCSSCIAREAVIETWAFACEEEAESVVSFLMGRVNHPTTPRKIGEVIAHFASHIANGDHRPDEDDEDE